MINQDIQFEIENEEGKLINCVILSSIPVSETEINIIYKIENEAEDLFRYGKIIKTEDSFRLTKGITETELLELKESLNNEIVTMCEDIVNNMED